MMEHQGRVVATVVPNTKAAMLMPHIIERTMPASTVFTDEYLSYDQLTGLGYGHRRVKQAAKVYVSGSAHTNTIEGFGA